MTRIFSPILSSILIYIDDLLLFSPDIESHVKLLTSFHDLVTQYGIMLSANKMIIGQPFIDFLGLQISNGQYVLQPHIANQLDTFPVEALTTKQIQ